MIILGIDPGTATTGWGIVKKTGKKYELIGYGCILTPANTKLEDRLETIYKELTIIIKKNKPTHVVVEQIFFAANAKTAIAVGHARGVILLAAKNCGVNIEEYTPLQVKMNLTGYGRAEKRKIQDTVKEILCLECIPKPDDASDALAIAICHGQLLAKPKKKKLLLHTCCGPCFLGTWEDLKNNEIEITNYFYNPNIQPKLEYTKRLSNLKKAIKRKSSAIIEERYDEKEHLEIVKGMEDKFPERCLKCYSLRLAKTANFAKDNGYDAFSTTLLVSPYQKHDEIKIIGEKLEKNLGIEFYYKDFREYFEKGQQSAKKLDIYRQKYCGCKYSKEYR